MAKVTAGLTAAYIGMKRVYDFAEGGAEIGRLEVASTKLAASMDGNMGDIVTSIVKASQGTIDNFSAMQSASTAMMLGLGADADKLGQLMEVAAVRGHAMGLSTTQSFNDMVRGIGRLSPMILDNLGIVIDANTTYAAYATTLGKAADDLTSMEKRQALLNRVIEEGQQIINETGGLRPDAMTGYERVGASLANFWNGIKEDFGYFLGTGLLTGDEALVMQQDRVEAVLDNSASTYNEYSKAISGAAMAEGGYINSNGDLVRAIYEYDDATQGVVQTGEEILQHNYALTKSDWARAQALNAQAEAYFNAQQQARFYAETIGEIPTDDENYLTVGLSGGAQDIIDEYVSMMEKAGGSTVKQAAAVEQLTKNTDEYAMSLVQLLGSEKISIAAQMELGYSMGLIDQNSLNLYGALNVLTDAFDANKNGIIDAGKEGLAWSKGVSEMFDKWNGAVLNDKSATITINFLVNGIASYIPWDFGYQDIWGNTWFNPTAKIGAETGSISGVPRAGGGDVIKGQSYLVGEEGMELFVPDTNGTIIPNNKLGSSGNSLVGGSYQPILVNINNPLFIGTNKNEIKRVIGPAVKELVEAEKLRNG